MVLCREKDDLVGRDQQFVVGTPRRAADTVVVPLLFIVMVLVLVLVDVETLAQLALNLAQHLGADVVVRGCGGLRAAVVVGDDDEARGWNNIVMVGYLQQRVGLVADDQSTA